METNEISIVIYAFTFILLAIGIFLLLFYVLFKQKQKSHRLKIIALNQELLQTQVEIQEQTLKNVSEEIHDNIGQILTLAKLNLATLVDIHDERNKERVSGTRELISKAINDLRDLSRSMHGERIAETGLQNSVENELKFINHSGKFQTQLTFAGDCYKLTSQAEMLLFRIVQEALHNEIKHSKAKNIFVHFYYGTDEFSIMLKDDGIGFNIDNVKPGEAGIGLKSMRNRASLAGADLIINSSLNEGTEIIVKITKNIPKFLISP